MHIKKDSDFTRDCFAVTFWLSPDRRPDLYAVVAHHRMVAERHGAGLDRNLIWVSVRNLTRETKRC